MFRVGLTGNIASGKSSVASIWRERGAPVVDADRLARDAVAPGTAGLRAIVERWGDGVLAPDGTLDRAALRSIVFDDEHSRRALEAIVHPEVDRLRREAFSEAERAGDRIVVADIPLLYEVGLEDRFDLVVLVDAPPEERVRRIVRDRGLEEAEARRMVDAQMPAEAKRRKADIVIDNDGTLESLEAAARRAWDEILARAGEGGTVNGQT